MYTQYGLTLMYVHTVWVDTDVHTVWVDTDVRTYRLN